MIWRPIGKPKTAQELHIANVYADPEFHTDLKKILPNYKDMQQSFFVEGAKGRAANKQLEDAAPYLPELAIKYCISLSDISFYVAGLNLNGNIAREDPTNDITLDEDGNFTVHFDYTVTKDDFDDLWSLISEHRHTVYGDVIPKYRPPVDDKLLYAIFKAKSEAKAKGKKLTYLNIHTMYKMNELKGYDFEIGRKNKVFTDEKTLAKYYRSNQPRLKSAPR